MLLCSGFSSVIAVGCIAIEYIKCKFSNSKFRSSKTRKTQTWAAQALTPFYNTKWLKMKDLVQTNKFLWFTPRIRSYYITRSVRSDHKILLRYIVHFHNANKNWSFSEWYQLVVITVSRTSALGLILCLYRINFSSSLSNTRLFWWWYCSNSLTPFSHLPFLFTLTWAQKYVRF